MIRNSAARPVNATDAAVKCPFQSSGKNAVMGKVCLLNKIVGSGSASPRPRSIYGVKVCMSVIIVSIILE